jgi:predicted transcriptional regulator
MTDDSSTTKTIKFTEENLEVPLADILAGRGFITGKSGSGKSNTAGKICEEILEQSRPLMVIDTEGEYYGLKEEYELLHVGADDECDLQVGPEHAEKIAELALVENVPIILDVSGYIETSEVNQLVHDTVKAMFDKEKKLKKPFPILVEEAHEWIPEQGSRGEDGEVTKMLIRVGKRGRKRGLGLGALSQRPASVDKDFITQTDYKIWHQLDWDNDLDVVRRVLGKDYVDTVKNLETGEAILQTDFVDDCPRKIQVLEKKTFDAGATPDLEEFEQPELKSVSGDLVDELQEISEKKQKEQNRIQQLEEKLEEKEEEIESLEEDLDRAQDMTDMAEQFTQAMASGGSPEVQEKVDEIREEKNEKIRELESRNEELQSELEDLKAERQELQQRVEDLEEYERAQENMEELREAVLRMTEALDLETQGKTDEKLKNKVRRKDEKIDELEAKIQKLQQQGYSLDDEFEEKMDFLKHESVKEEVEKAADKTTYDEGNAWDALSVLVDQEKATLDDIAPYVDINRSSISSVMARLAEHGVVKKGKKGQKNEYELNTDGMKDIIQTQKKRSEMEELKERVKKK